MQNEITEPGNLLNENGELNHKGYSRNMVLSYNRENIKTYPFKWINGLRIKEWDYYAVISHDYFFSATVANIGYIGMAFVYLIDFNKSKIIEETIITPLGKGCNLPASSLKDDVIFRHKDTEISFLRYSGKRVIRVNMPSFNDKEGLSAEITLSCNEKGDSIVMATPITKKRFYYNQKITAIPAEGIVIKGANQIGFESGKCLGVLDWGRGVWQYSSFWNWACGSGFYDDDTRIGINLGQGFGDLSHASENCFFINDKMTKLGSVSFRYDSEHFMKPWIFTSDCGKLKLTFTPIFDRVAKTNALILKSSVHQLFGLYEGLLKTSDKTYKIEKLIGWAEEHKARW